LAKGRVADEFEKLADELDAKSQALAKARQKTSGWRDPLAPDDTQNALAQAQVFERSILRFLQPSFWRLKKTLQARYDFSQHAVAPPWSKVLKELAAQHEAQSALDSVRDQARKEWHSDDAPAFQSLVAGLKADPLIAHASVKALIRQLSQSAEGGVLIENLAGIHKRFSELDATLRALLAEHEQFDFPELTSVLTKLREQTGVL